MGVKVNFGVLSQIPLKVPPPSVLLFLSKPGGINTVVGANQLNRDQLVSCINWYYDKTGALTTRPGLTAVSNARITGSVIAQAHVDISGTKYHLIQDSQFNLYKLDSGTPTLISKLDGRMSAIQFNGNVMLLDGGYLKSWDGANVRLAYDHASYMSDSSLLTLASTTKFTGSITKIGNKFTTTVFSTSIDMPLVQCKATLTKTGTPSGTFKAVLALASDYTVVGESTTITNLDTGAAVNDVSDITTSLAEYKFDFSNNIVIEPNTEYIVYIEFLGSDATNYISISYATSTAGKATSNNTGVWTDDATKDYLMGIGAGLPPKCTMGLVADHRLHLAGSPDYPGREFYSNVNDANDWSTDNGSGWIGIIDNDPFNYQIGGMMRLFGSIWFVGKPDHPYFVQLNGTGPSDYSMVEKFSDQETNNESVSMAVNDGLFAGSSGVFSVSGVNKYGDLQFANLATNIRNQFAEFYNANAVSGYDKNSSHYWVQLENMPFVLIGHKSLMTADQNGGAEMPWTTYSFSGRTPTSFEYYDGVFYVGFNDGILYKLDENAASDNGTKIEFNLLSGIDEVAFQQTEVSDYFVSGTVYGSRGEVSLRLYAGDDEQGDDFNLESGLVFESGLQAGALSFYNEDLDTSVIPYDRPADYITRQVQVGITNHRNMGRFYMSGIALQTKSLQE